MMNSSGVPALVVTSINAPNRALRAMSEAAAIAGWRFIVIGDEKSPADFSLRDCEFWPLRRQRDTGFRFASACPTRHYARKNIGYLLAARGDASVIVETDDDNIPRDGFYRIGERQRVVPVPTQPGWINVYAYFTRELIWPRGLPLNSVRRACPPLTAAVEIDAPIQQSLADGDPDVDAVYRLLMPLPISFDAGRAVGMPSGRWCPFNSQNTTWWKDAWPLMYLPAYCSFRMTDIWRSFVAQRIAWANDWSVLFTSPTVYQERNEHDLDRDFRDEVPGYLHNNEIASLLDGIPCPPGADNIADNMRSCYRALASAGLVGETEPDLLEAWLLDMDEATSARRSSPTTAGVR